jgi:hypothetical protein
MFFTTDIDVDVGIFTMVFVHDVIRLELSFGYIGLIEVPIENEGHIDFDDPLVSLEWNEESFTLSSYYGRQPSGTMRFRVPVTPGLMASFKTAVNDWNNKFAVFHELLG